MSKRIIDLTKIGKDFLKELAGGEDLPLIIKDKIRVRFSQLLRKKKVGVKVLKKLPSDWFKLTPEEQRCFKKAILSEEQSKELNYKLGDPIKFL